MNELKEKAKALPVTMQIGKNGLTETVVAEVIKQLKKRKLVKIKLLKAFIEANDRKKAAEELAERTDSTLVNAVGFTVVLYKNPVRFKNEGRIKRSG